MTDKEIRALIERRRKDWRYGNSVEAKYKAEECDDILELMDEQEEPVSKVWHDAQIDPPQAKKKILAINEYCSCEVDYAINMALYWPKVIKWAYIDDLLKLDNSCQSCENLQEEPVSEDIEEAAESYAKFERSDGGGGIDVTRLDAFIEGAQWQKKQKPVSKDLKEAATQICQKVLKGETEVWHGANISPVEPDDNHLWVVVLFKNGDIHGCFIDTLITWQKVQLDAIKCWAYKEDLIPKD